MAVTPATKLHSAVTPRVAGIAEGLLTRLASGSDAAAQARGTAEQAHRPWPLPDAPWLQGQTWRDLLFAHWPLPLRTLREVVPAQLPVDTFDGHAWLGITPFEVSGLRARGTLPVPGVSRFPETNVRTYTTVDGRPGIYFLSLDAASRLAVLGARRAYRLPYFRARMSIAREGEAIDYATTREEPAAALRIRYRPSGGVFQAAPGTLEHFLTERYCLYVTDERGRVLRADIHHPPWPLQAAEAIVEHNTMTAPYGIELPAGDPLLHFSRRQDVLIWPLAPSARVNLGPEPAQRAQRGRQRPGRGPRSTASRASPSRRRSP